MDYTTTSTNINSNYMQYFSGPWMIFWLVFSILAIVGMWKTYAKAGKPGWAALIPIYNIYVWLKIIDRPGWWLLLFLIPIVNIVLTIMIAVEMAKVFGKGAAYGFFWLWLFSPIGFLMLGFGKAKYIGTSPSKASE